jgi:hypothetical protein
LSDVDSDSVIPRPRNPDQLVPRNVLGACELADTDYDEIWRQVRENQYDAPVIEFEIASIDLKGD